MISPLEPGPPRIVTSRLRRPRSVTRAVAACAIGALIGGMGAWAGLPTFRQGVIELGGLRASHSVVSPAMSDSRPPTARAEDFLKRIGPLSRRLEETASTLLVDDAVRKEWLQMLGALAEAARPDRPEAVSDELRGRAYRVLRIALAWTENHGRFTPLERAQLLDVTTNLVTRRDELPHLVTEARSILASVDGERGHEARRAKAMAQRVIRIYRRLFPDAEVAV